MARITGKNPQKEITRNDGNLSLQEWKACYDFSGGKMKLTDKQKRDIISLRSHPLVVGFAFGFVMFASMMIIETLK